MKRIIERTFLTSGVLAALCFWGAATATAVDFKVGDVHGTLDSTLSLQLGIRTSGQDCALIGPGNGGCTNNGYKGGANVDDGDINTARWQPYTTRAELSQEMQLDWSNYGAFLRWKAYYDYWNAEETGTRNGDFGPSGTGLGHRSLDDAVRGDVSDQFNGAGYGAQFLDVFAYANWNVADAPLNVRLGNQVVNWGESLYIPGGINSYISYDLTELRTPGSDLKNAVLPFPALYASVGLPYNLSLEGWYKFWWQPAQLDTAGTFFSGTDYFGSGGAYQSFGKEYDTAVQDAGGVNQAFTQGYLMRRADDDDPRSQGEFGTKLGYYADWLNNGTDFGFYYTNFHSTYPILTYTRSTELIAVHHQEAFAHQRYLAQYAPDIHMIGVSFNTMLADFLNGTAFSGELAYSPNMAFQVASTTIHAQDFAGYTIDGTPLTPAGQIIPGYKRKSVITGQLSTISTLPTSNFASRLLDSDLVTLIANVGFQDIPNKNPNDQLNIPGTTNYSVNRTIDAALGDGQCPGNNGVQCVGAQYASHLSWGYRLSVSPQYDNAFGTAFTLAPRIVWSHDVSGYSAGPIGPGFIQGVKKISLGFNVSYLSSWNLDVQWTSAFGNKLRNSAYDKDFASATLSYAL